MKKKISLPLTDEVIDSLHAGDMVYLTGTVYSARDAAHKRMTETLEEGKELPFDIRFQTVYYLGPTPARTCTRLELFDAHTSFSSYTPSAAWTTSPLPSP